jgi:enoyl-[acyl-carrier protein] reductase III
MVDEAVAAFPRVDIVISNAAFGTPGTVMGAKPRHWEVTMAASAQALQWLAQSAAPRMKGWGRIVALSSEGGQRVLPGYGVVGVAKAALESLTRALAVELAPSGILVNGIIAGASDTKSSRAIPGFEEHLAEVVARTPVGRVVTPDDVADVVAFLCSEQAKMICGQFLVVDGGRAVLA